MDYPEQLKEAVGRITALEEENARLREECSRTSWVAGFSSVEEALRESEDKFKFLFDTMAQGVVLQDTESRIIEANNAACEILGLSMDQLLGKSSYDPGWKLIREDGSPTVVEEMPSMIALRTGKPVFNVIRGVYWPKTNEYRWIMINSVPKFAAGSDKPYLTMTTFTDITKRKRAEEEMHKREATIRSIFRAAPTGIGVVVNRVFVEVNDRILVMTGYSREELIGQSARMIYPTQEDFELVGREKYDQISREGTGTVETRWRRKDGEVMDILLSSTPLDPDDLTAGVTFTALDITERRRAEEALKESEERFRSLFEAMTEGVAIHELIRDEKGIPVDYRIIDVNPAYIRQSGISAEKARGALASELYGSGKPPFFEIYAKVAETGESYSFEAFFAPLEKHFAISVFSPGAEKFATVFEDITERKRSEETIKLERAYLASAIELLPFPIFLITPPREVIRQNRASTELLSAPNGHRWWGIQLLDPRTHQPIPEQDWPMLHAFHGEPVPTREFIMALPDGRELPILLQVASIVVGEEKVAIAVAFQDISVLKEADQAKNQFLMTLSHELKTPLTNIIGWSQLAESAPEVVPMALTTILRNAEEQRNMLERLLIISRMLMGKLVLVRKRMNLWELVKKSADRYLAEAEKRHISLALEPPEEEWPVMADGKLLSRALDEIVENAVEFSETDGIVTISGRQVDGNFHITAQDTGRGIEKEALSLLLKPFQQIQREEVRGGIGIGLALARGIIEAHGGRVEISSEGVGRGTTVTIDFPSEFQGGEIADAACGEEH